MVNEVLMSDGELTFRAMSVPYIWPNIRVHLRELGSATIRHSQFGCQANLELSLGNFQLDANVTDLSIFAFTLVAVV